MQYNFLYLSVDTDYLFPIRTRNISYFKYIKERITKLYPTLFLIVLFLLVVIPLWEGGINPATIRSLLLKLTLLFNFIPGEALSVTGPFWFFSLIVQLYLLFPLLLFLQRKYGDGSLLLVSAFSLLITLIFNNYFYARDVSLYVLFVGQLPVFCMGIYAASKPKFHLPDGLIIAALILFILGNEFELFWYFSSVAFTLFMLPICFVLFQLVEKISWLNSFLLYSGSISLYLFAVHGLARFPFEYISEKYENLFITSALSLVYLAGVYFLAWGVKRFDWKVQTRIS